MKALRALALSLFVCSVSAFAQNAAPLPISHLQFLDANGNPLAGGMVYTCVAGSSCPGTPQNSYTDSTAGTPNTNPVVLDASGSAAIWIGSTAYKIVVQNSAGVTQWSADNVTAANAVGSSLQSALAAASGSSMVGYEASGSSTVRTVAAKLGDFVSLLDFGAKGNGTTNDTSAIQAALNSGAAVIDGGGKTYLVSGNLAVLSNTTLQNFSLSLVSGSSTPLAGLLIDGTTAAKSNITLRNITINGNRAGMSSFGSPSDGDKSCILAQGTVSNFTVDGVNASYCGTDGLQVWSYSAPASDNDSALRFHNVAVRNSTFKYNRRQGASFDSVYNLTISNVTAEYNGLDMAEIQTLYAGTPNMSDLGDWVSGTFTPVATCNSNNSTGDCAARTGSMAKYASGFDLEGYGIGSAFHGVRIANCVALHNANGILILDSANPASSGFQLRQGFEIVGDYFDEGLYPSSNFAWPFALNIDSAYAEYTDISIAGNTFLGPVSAFGGNAIVIAGNRINSESSGYAVYTGSTTNLDVIANETDGVLPVRYYDALGTQDPEWLTKVAPTTNANTFSNYALDFGPNANPVGMGMFSTFFSLQSFGLPIAIDPAHTFPLLIGTSTNQSGELQVAGGINVQQDQNGSLMIGRYNSSTNTNAIINIADNDGSTPSALVFDFSGTAKASVTSSGAYTSAGSTGATTTVTCSAGTHISGITVVGGIVTSVGACN